MAVVISGKQPAAISCDQTSSRWTSSDRCHPWCMRKLLLLLPLIALLTACKNPLEMDYCLRRMAVGDKVEAETKKALGLGENDDLEVYCKEYEDIALSSGMVFLRRR